MSVAKQFQIIDHTADWAIRVWGATLTDLLRNAARGMNSLLTANPAAVPQTETRHLTLIAYDVEELLVDFLTELAYWAETEHLIFHQIALTAVTPTTLTATLHGGPADELQKHIKAVTYHHLEIVETAVGLQTTIVFDV